MTVEDFEAILDAVVIRLGGDVRGGQTYHAPDLFEKRVQEVLIEVAETKGLKIDRTFHPSAFPDIRANGFGVEVKTTVKDDWQSIGNSVLEGMRDASVTQIYIVFGKLGGMPAVRWGRYGDCIGHVRTSHAPRFVIDMERNVSLFKKMDISYEGFAALKPVDKMRHIRKYARNRLKPGELLWWMEDENSNGVPVTVKLYMNLPKEEKTRLRAEGALLFPEIVGGSRKKDKYNKVAFYFLNHHNVFCPQARDLFSAGSVAGTARGGNYLLRSLKNIEAEMKEAAEQLDDELFEVYWGKRVVPHKRIAEWLRRADRLATGWKPSEFLFLG